MAVSSACAVLRTPHREAARTPRCLPLHLQSPPPAGGLLMLVPSRRSPDSAEPRPLIARTASSPWSGAFNEGWNPRIWAEARPAASASAVRRPDPASLGPQSRVRSPRPCRSVPDPVPRGLPGLRLSGCSPSLPDGAWVHRAAFPHPCLGLPFLLLMKPPSCELTASSRCRSS